MQNSYWKEGTRQQWILCASDNSPLDKLQEKVNIDLIQYAVNDEPLNLGIKKINGRIYSGNYVGLCRLTSVSGKALLTYDGREVILKIEPRFNISVVDMLNALKDDDEFERYLAPQTTRIGQADKEINDLLANELFYFFNNEDPVFIQDSLALSSSIITATVFVTMLKDLCKRPLMGRMISREENLVGKAKGKILFKENIRKNTMRGRSDRLYCKYLEYSEDIIENQVLKAALHKAALFLNRYFGSASGQTNSIREILTYCQNALSHITLIRVSQREMSSVKATGCYVHYRPVINIAKMVMSEISIGANGDSTCTSYIVPYAVSMSKLFEMYVRATLKRTGIKSYLSDEPGLHILKYDYKAKVLAESATPYAAYIGGNVKPDIILFDTETRKYTVYDVKYKRLTSGGSSRNDRLQLLAYALMFDCENVGIIFPTLEDGKSTFYERNLIQTMEVKDRYYNQLELSIDIEVHSNIESKDKQRLSRLLPYFESVCK